MGAEKLGPNCPNRREFMRELGLGAGAAVSLLVLKCSRSPLSPEFAGVPDGFDWDKYYDDGILFSKIIFHYIINQLI